MRATFRGGYTLAVYKADVATGDAQEIWHNQPNDPLVDQPHGRAPRRRVPDLPVRRGPRRARRRRRGGAAAAATPQTPAAACRRVGTLLLAQRDRRGGPPRAAHHDRRPDRKSDLDRALGRRQDASTTAPTPRTSSAATSGPCPSSGGTPVQITTGEGVETSPAPLASGKYLATLSAGWNMPQSLGIWKIAADAPATQKIIFPEPRSPAFRRTRT